MTGATDADSPGVPDHTPGTQPTARQSSRSSMTASGSPRRGSHKTEAEAGSIEKTAAIPRPNTTANTTATAMTAKATTR